MSRTRTLLGFLVIAALLGLQVGVAYAAPASQTSTVDGTVQSITQSTDTSGNAIFDVTILKSDGTTQTVKLSAADAATLGLVTANADGTYTINNVVGTTVSIPTSEMIPDPCSEPESGVVASALAAFFCAGGSTVLDNTVAALHSEGFGFGEIAQSCFMAEVLQTTCGDILDAKKSHDFSVLGVPAGVSNWGQLKKYAMGQEVKSLTNLGAIMSGRATPPAANPTPGPTPVPTPGAPVMPYAGNGNGHGQGNGNGHGQGNGNGNGHGNGHNP
jgi:hypothetical protein